MDAKHLRQLMPRNAHDAEAARNLVSLGPEVLEPVVPDMIRRLKDHKSEVVDVYCEFFSERGECFASMFGQVLGRSTMPDLKNVIVTRILPRWSRDAVAKVAGALQMLVTHSDFFDTDLMSIWLLHKHSLADAKWLSDWLEFKRTRLSRLLVQANEVAESLVTSSDAP